jgi:ADP-sugar diphosphatase
MNSLRLAARHLKLTQPTPTRRPTITIKAKTKAMSTFTVPNSNLHVNSIPDLSQDDLLSFPAFKIWITTLQQSLARQEHPSHEFHSDPYVLRKINIQSVDRFGGGRLGFVKLKAEVSNGQGETLPGSVFLRGGSVGMLVSCPPPTTKLEPFLLDKRGSRRKILRPSPTIENISLFCSFLIL